MEIIYCICTIVKIGGASLFQSPLSAAPVSSFPALSVQINEVAVRNRLATSSVLTSLVDAQKGSCAFIFFLNYFSWLERNEL